MNDRILDAVIAHKNNLKIENEKFKKEQDNKYFCLSQILDDLREAYSYLYRDDEVIFDGLLDDFTYYKVLWSNEVQDFIRYYGNKQLSVKWIIGPKIIRTLRKFFETFFGKVINLLLLIPFPFFYSLYIKNNTLMFISMIPICFIITYHSLNHNFNTFNELMEETKNYPHTLETVEDDVVRLIKNLPKNIGPLIGSSPPPP